MLLKIVIVLAVVLAGLAVFITTQPGTYQVTRNATISAPPDKVFALLNDFHQWEHWSPWEKLDPAMKRTHSGSPAGAGSIYAWAGNSDVGEGRMTIKASQPSSRISIYLEFLKPFASTSDTEFTLEPSGQGTAVTWTMRGNHNFLSKAMCLFMGGMDKMIGPDFEKGLAQLKALSEKS